LFNLVSTRRGKQTGRSAARNLVAHLVRDEGVAGSNPATPTNLPANISMSCPVGSEGSKRGPGQLSGQKRRSKLSPPTSAPLLIVIEPTPSGRKWTSRLHDRVLCVTASPFVKSARLLLAEGYSAGAVIEMWRPNTDELALRGRLGAVAATIIDGETTSRCAKNGSPARDPEQGGQRAAVGSRSCSGHFWVGR
jgi:hypothetical protein